jgi:hypothetical protein
LAARITVSDHHMTFVIAAISNPRALGALGVLVGIILIVVGAVVATSSCGSSGLIWMGAGCILGGFGGTAVVGWKSLYVGGSAGLILVVLGVGLQSAFGCVA